MRIATVWMSADKKDCKVLGRGAHEATRLKT